MRWTNRTALPPERFEALVSHFPEQRTLEDVVRWTAVQSTATRIADVVVQDEFTHDVVVPWLDGVVLVYDCT